MLCTHKKDGEEKIQLMQIAESLEGIKKQIGPNPPMSRRRSLSVAFREHSLNKVQEEPIEEHIESMVSDTETVSTAPKDERDDLVYPSWIEDRDVRKGEVDYLSSAESIFWKDMLDEYLFPIDENKKEKARAAKDLKDLRDKCVFAFFMINALFVLIIFLLTLKKDYLHIKWPFGVKSNITYEENSQE
ncbi:krotzkopf verkehrt, partial [Carabus blaptoides fortunei]